MGVREKICESEEVSFSPSSQFATSSRMTFQGLLHSYIRSPVLRGDVIVLASDTKPFQRCIDVRRQMPMFWVGSSYG